MKRDAHFLFLGTGGSMGIPVIGCHCAVCRSESPCNKRLRPSGLITFDEKKFLIDCGPDFRSQALAHHIDRLDGMFLTHAHQDHIAGIDELRVFYMRTKQYLPCLLSADTEKDLRTRYHYIFGDESDQHKITARMKLNILPDDRGNLNFEGLQVRYMTYEQSGMKVNGYRFGNLAYISDIKVYPDTIFDDLAGVDILILSALRYSSSPMHLTIDDAIAFSNRVGAKNTWLTHIAHELDHEDTNSRLPPNVRMSYDGLKLIFKM